MQTRLATSKLCWTRQMSCLRLKQNGKCYLKQLKDEHILKINPIGNLWTLRWCSM